MSSKTEKNVQFNVHRYDPHQRRRYVSTYEVPVRKGMTLLEALMYIKDNLDETLAFRQSCRMGICGSCGIMVNGKPMLACYTQILHLDSDSLAIEPLQKMRIIKDLVVDIEPFLESANRITPLLIKPEDQLKEPQEFHQTPEELRRFWALTLCTKCSICYSACPATMDEKFLGPSTYATNYRFITDSRDTGSQERMQAMVDNVWLCTSCNSCTLFCPKEVDSASSITEERSLIVESGTIPRAVTDVLTNTFKYHNPMGMHQDRRTEWTKDLKVNAFPTTTKADVLCYVCCSTAYDPRNQGIARSLASILGKMGVNFATLGAEEWCCGDHQLRLGERGLYETLAEHNVAAFDRFEADRIVTISPHCFHTLKNDSPYSEADLNVQHYTQYVDEALSEGRLSLDRPVTMRAAYHDPCFLGKRSGVYDAPRRILQAIEGIELVEMKRTRENSFCCGGGAGRVWTEDALPEKRPNIDRVREAIETGADTIITACPFCVTTLEDAVKVLDLEEKLAVRDILEVLDKAK